MIRSIVDVFLGRVACYVQTKREREREVGSKEEGLKFDLFTDVLCHLNVRNKNKNPVCCTVFELKQVILMEMSCDDVVLDSRRF